MFFAVLRQPVYVRQLMRWRKMGVADGHLDALVTGYGSVSPYRYQDKSVASVSDVEIRAR